MAGEDTLLRREFELRLQGCSASYERYRSAPERMRGLALAATIDAAVLCHVLDNTADALTWFSRAAEGGAFDYALFALDFDRADRILKSRTVPEESQEALKWHLAKGEDATVREIASRRPAAKSQGWFEAVANAAVGIVDGDPERLGKGLDAILIQHMRSCSRGRSRFNGCHAFMSHQASALSALAVRRGVPVQISKKFVPARVPVLFVAITDPLENPPSHVGVDLVPEVYRTPAPSL